MAGLILAQLHVHLADVDVARFSAKPDRSGAVVVHIDLNRRPLQEIVRDVELPFAQAVELVSGCRQAVFPQHRLIIAQPVRRLLL